MQAGVVKTKTCTRDYHCTGCRFDRVLRRLARENYEQSAAGTPVKGRRGRIVYWAFKLRERPAHRRPCLHSLKRRITFRPCTNDYICHNCEFDQYFQDQFLVHAVIKPVDLQSIEGFRVPQGVYLHHGHTWVAMAAGGQVRIGLDDFAARLLGPMDRIDLPLLGKPLEQDQAGISMHRQDLKANLLAPISGVVTALNTDIGSHPQPLADDPYGNGWLLMVQPTNLREELPQLKMGADEVSGFIASEVTGLHQALEPHLGPLATDGGQLSDDILRHLPRSAWEAVTRQILKG
jgi:glycine cleavage system H lipoate-binding protein